MKSTQQIIDILADGKPRSIGELMALTGLPREKVRNAITALTHQEMADAEPVKYSLTSKGARRVGWRPKTRQERTDLCSARQKKRRADLRKAEEAADRANKVRDAIAAALCARTPNSVFALGARNAE